MISLRIKKMYILFENSNTIIEALDVSFRAMHGQLTEVIR